MFSTSQWMTWAIAVLVLTFSQLDRDGTLIVSDAALAAPF